MMNVLSSISLGATEGEIYGWNRDFDILTISGIVLITVGLIIVARVAVPLIMGKNTKEKSYILRFVVIGVILIVLGLLSTYGIEIPSSGWS